MKGTITAKKTFRYYTFGDPSKASHLIFVLHGYGQLAEYFLRKFHSLPEKYFIVAPEGMHRFYLNGSSGRIGASWMTKEEREFDIAENINWLNELNKMITEAHQFKKCTILGFSQGGATAARWFYNESIHPNQLIIWASVFPPDLKIDNEIQNSIKGSNYFIIGQNDEFYSSEEQLELLAFYKSKGFTSILNKGGHEIEIKTIKEILEKA